MDLPDAEFGPRAGIRSLIDRADRGLFCANATKSRVRVHPGPLSESRAGSTGPLVVTPKSRQDSPPE